MNLRRYALHQSSLCALPASSHDIADQFNVGRGISSVACQADSARLPMSLSQTQQTSTTFSPPTMPATTPSSLHSPGTYSWYHIRPSAPIYIVGKITYRPDSTPSDIQLIGVFDHYADAEVAAKTCSPHLAIYHTFPPDVDAFRPALEPATQICVALIRRAIVQPGRRALVAIP